ncbi:uncharacterized protein J8A68_002146 [[Candida] subhashii]|uniref:SnoaL-like domain-containing protein n=1 Tax=[Candida] subhashii TaxID=561895 RepID=A0A8J5QS73_9ASCO|nr:uncharacterized protein J8A68_002146 [[Candida] subhashii]KAG7664327.1 hypothetical protein J8A68_002146 [[Candida] subhashii]
MTNYSPTLATNTKFQDFVVSFYKTSDTAPPSSPSVDPYLQFFTPEAPLTMASKRVVGHSEITELRKGMWTSVTKRHHVVENVASVDDETVLVNGYVDYRLINNKDITTEWAAIMKLTKSEEGEYKMKFYQVYLDPSVAAKALTE